MSIPVNEPRREAQLFLIADPGVDTFFYILRTIIKESGYDPAHLGVIDWLGNETSLVFLGKLFVRFLRRSTKKNNRNMLELYNFF